MALEMKIIEMKESEVYKSLGWFFSPIVVLLILQIWNYYEQENFYKEEFSAKITKQHNWTGYVINFELENGYIISFLKRGNFIKIGDSIVKKKDTYLFRLYLKKKDQTYEYSGYYDFRKTY